eukprot:638964-Prymnesium_polylepis.2
MEHGCGRERTRDPSKSQPTVTQASPHPHPLPASVQVHGRAAGPAEAPVRSLRPSERPSHSAHSGRRRPRTHAEHA